VRSKTSSVHALVKKQNNAHPAWAEIGSGVLLVRERQEVASGAGGEWRKGEKKGAQGGRHQGREHAGTTIPRFLKSSASEMGESERNSYFPLEMLSSGGIRLMCSPEHETT